MHAILLVSGMSMCYFKIYYVFYERNMSNTYVS